MNAEQVATNALIGNLIAQALHIFIALLSIGEGYILLRYRRENQRQQDQIDECRRTLASIDEKLENALKCDPPQ